MNIGKHVYELGLEYKLLETFPDGLEKLHRIIYTKFFGCQFAETKNQIFIQILLNFRDLNEKSHFVSGIGRP